MNMIIPYRNDPYRKVKGVVVDPEQRTLKEL